jgi:hypothetical protein
MGKKKRQPPQKPTGTTGAVTFGGGEPTFTPVKFPLAKREIEQLVMQVAFRASRDTGVNLRTLYQLTAEPRFNPDENDWDILLPTARGEQHLDLMEAAPLNALGRDGLPPSLASRCPRPSRIPRSAASARLREYRVLGYIRRIGPRIEACLSSSGRGVRGIRRHPLHEGHPTAGANGGDWRRLAENTASG